jgi:hypothetical protein
MSSETTQRHSEALSGTQRHSEPLRGPLARGVHRPWPCVARPSTLSLTSAPPMSSLTRHLLSSPLCTTHRTGPRPFTGPLVTAHRWRWCRRSSRRTRRPPWRGTRYAAPPLAAWIRGPQRSSEVIICNKVQSGVIIRNQRTISGTQRALRGLSVALRGPQR